MWMCWTRRHLIRCLGACAAVMVLASIGCNNNTTTGAGGETLADLQTTGNRIGPAQVTPEQIQSEVDAYADRFVTAFAQACDSATRDHPDARNALHAVKLATASGAYTIAAGPNPVVAVIDMMVQATLLRHSLGTFLVPRLLDGEGGQLLDVLERYEQQAWAMGERVLNDAQRVELRSLIDTWIQENPTQIYVAGVRFSDFARLRPSNQRPANSVFALLKLDPFASLDPTNRQIEEARLLTERIFYYAQRMPQLLTWRAEQLHYTIVGSREIESLLADVDEFNASSRQLATTADELRTLIPDQTAAAVREFSAALTEQREQTVASLEQQQAKVSELVDRIDRTVESARLINTEVQQTLATADEVGRTLQTASGAVADAGRAWEGTANAFQGVAQTFKPEPGAPPRPDAEPIELADVVNALEQMQRTAIELRTLLDEVNTTAASDEFSRNVSAPMAQARRDMEGLVNHVTVRVILVIVAVLVAAMIYRFISSRLHPQQRRPRRASTHE